MNRWTSFPVLVALTLALAACGGTSSPESGRGDSSSARTSRTPSSSSAPSQSSGDASPTAAPAPPTSSAVTSLDVKGVRSVRAVTRTTGQTTGSQKASQSVVAMAADGTTVVARASISRTEDPDSVSQVRLYVTDARGARGPMTPIPLGPERAEPAQLVGATVSHDWVVWMETPSTDLAIQPWVMYAYDRGTGETTKVTTSRTLADGTPALVSPGWTGPSLHGDMAVWAEVAAGGKAPRVDIVGCSVSHCVRRTLLRGAAYPAVSATTVYAVTAPGYRGESGGHGGRDFHDVAIKAYEFATGKVRTVRRPDLKGATTTITGLAAAGSTLAWTTSATGGLPHLTISRRQSEIRITGTRGEQFAYPVATGSLIAWAEASGTSGANVGGYVFRFADHTIYSVGNTSGLYGIEAAGRHLSWQESQGTVGVPSTTVIAELE